MSRFLFSILSIFIFETKCFSQNKTNLPKGSNQISLTAKAEIDKLFAACNMSTPGYAIGIVKGENVLYANGYGAANLDYSIPIKTSSSFDIASVSKQFTGASIALLIMDKKLDLESAAFDYLSELKKYPDTIQIKHLLYNCSGLTDYYRLPRKSGKSWITFNYFDIDECISTSLAQDTLDFKPGTRWDYCNVNFMLLTKIVEKISGISFRQFMHERLFHPLSMKQTFVHDDITMVIKGRVTPYNKRTKENRISYEGLGIMTGDEGGWMQHQRNSPHYGGSGIVTTVDDLMKWSMNFFTRKIGGDEFFDLMHKRLSFPHSRNNQAFGLYFGKYKEREYVAWDGGDWGISSQLIRFPGKQIAIIVLSNNGNGESYRKANEIADILIAKGIL